MRERGTLPNLAAPRTSIVFTYLENLRRDPIREQDGHHSELHADLRVGNLARPLGDIREPRRTQSAKVGFVLGEPLLQDTQALADVPQVI